MKSKLSRHLRKFLNFLRSTDFSKAIILTLSIVIPISFFSSFSNLVIGIAIAKGCLLCSPSNVTGSLKHKIIGLVCASGLAAVSTVISGYAQFNIFLLVPVLAVLMFGISYLAVYGLRASLVSFSGLLAVVLSFTKIQSGLEIWQQGLLIFAGGLWYLLLSLLWYSLNPRKETDVLLAEAMQITSDYLKIRRQLLTPGKKRNKLQEKLFSLQTDLNEKHERLRETLIGAGKISGNNDYEKNRLMVFVELVDILELAMTNPVDYEKMDMLFKGKEAQLEALKSLIAAMAEHLTQLSSSLQYRRKLPKNNLDFHLSQLQSSIEAFRESMDVNERRESMLLLRNLYSYQNEQVQKINSIFNNLGSKKKAHHPLVKNPDILKFLSRQDYSPAVLLQNFNFNSTIFRHSLRLALIVVAGFSIGIYFSIQNAYWILLTIVVIMRPNYGLTKERSKQRIIGTLIGGGIAIAIVLLIQNKILYTILGIGSLTMAFSLLQRNYRTAAIYITLSIIFIYALMQPNVINVIEYRILDTIIGAGLAALGNYFLWPAWEIHSLKEQLINSLNANKTYLKEIDAYYHQKKELPVSYKLARKHAFISMGNLSAAFQRVTQEPESRQKEIDLIFRLVGLNQTFLSALASLGTFIRSNKTTSASASFEKMTEYIYGNIKKAEEILVNTSTPETFNNSAEIEEAKRGLSKSYEKLLDQRMKELESGKTRIDPEMRLQLREAQLVNHQLEWLRDLSENILNSVTKVQKIFNLNMD
ncbi:FUSC family membrane protein [Zunongwangia sp. F363]|uniref:FUSC family membrane protein n=1 Tax=Autumnicola tepida TaxID=3075595 RepID=A0ABU3C5Z0_9FLAO|nr:FUSC family membrane protein [Zunongwangia sp. F363]MDT0641749.1 FUSC family membrane protein [Zunongwangia sp. F363]